MALLVLVRHAKTEQAPPHPGQGDHDRELTARGRRDARTAGAWIVGRDAVPDLVLCSPSVRTRQTWEHMVAGAPVLAEVEVWTDRRIYEAGTEDLTGVLADVPQDLGSVLLLGHAPGVPALAAELAEASTVDAGVAATLARGYPTMTCLLLRTGQPWDGLTPGAARCTGLHTPQRPH